MTARSLAALGLVVTSACSVGQGSGSVHGELFARDCWGSLTSATTAEHGSYDMQPDFFAADPYRTTLQIRVQRGTDLTEVSDGLWVLIDDVCKVRAALGESCDNTAQANVYPTDGGTGLDGGILLGPDGGVAAASFAVDVPAGVHPPGSPSALPENVSANPPIVHMALYLERTCHNQNIVLYTVSGTTTFQHLFDADPNESRAIDKLTEASFDVWFADVSDTPLGGTPEDVPIGLQSHISGGFRFYFERGQPGQPFP